MRRWTTVATTTTAATTMTTATPATNPIDDPAPTTGPGPEATAEIAMVAGAIRYRGSDRRT